MEREERMERGRERREGGEEGWREWGRGKNKGRDQTSLGLQHYG